MLVVFDTPVPVVTLVVPVVLGTVVLTGVCEDTFKGLPSKPLPVNDPGLKGFVPEPVVTVAGFAVVGLGKSYVLLDPTPVEDFTFEGPL